MLRLIFISIIFKFLIHANVFKDIVENTNMLSTYWQLDDNTPYTSTAFCTEQNVGPFLGLLDSNVKRSFSNVRSHYSITLSLEIYYTEYWGTFGNYFKIILDGTEIFSDSNIFTTSLSTPSTYCQFNNILGIPRNNQLTTILNTMSHQNTNFLLEIQGSFNCAEIVHHHFFCERAGIKNLYLFIEECHESCLTCTGPLKMNCLTCPQGVVTLGQCSCGTLFVSKNQCVASCSANEEVVSGYCVESCGINCLVCLNQICTSCQIDYQLYQGKCLISCPSYSIANGTNCDDLTTINNQGSEYLGKYFYTLENNIVDDLAPFTFISSSGNSLLTGQKYCIYRDLFILGGLGVWADGIFQISFSALSPHNTVRIQMKLYFIDSWNGEEFVIRVDGVQVYSKTVVSTSQSLNLMFRDAKDLIEPVTLTLSHLSSNLMIEFESKLTQSAFIASAGITDLFILIDYCEISCAVCGTSSCTLCLSPYTLIANKCVICGSANFRNSNCSCMDGYFDDLQINCQQCSIQCSSCLSLAQCTNCNVLAHYINLPNCSGCELGYYQTSSNECLQCISNCVICDNSELCYQCLEGFYQNVNYICTQCSQNCISCNLEGCLICEFNYGLNSLRQCAYCNTNEIIIAGSCQQCQSRCLSCFDQLENCLTCQFPRVNAPNCLCQDGYFESLGQCSLCHLRCTTCEFDWKNCITCMANRINVPTCDCSSDAICDQCLDGFYRHSNLTCTECSQNCLSCSLSGCQICEPNYGLNIALQCVQCNSNETVIIGQCQQCNSQCLSCVYQLDNCLTCQFPRVNAPNCQCQDGYFELSTQCQHCDQRCATCFLSQTNCISCIANRTNAPKCDCTSDLICEQCQVGYYRNSNLTCIQCSMNCKSCNIDGCYICEPNYGLNTALDCVQCNSNETVIAGYCEICQNQCLSCVEQLDNCVTCPFPRVNAPNCKCQDGYFETSGQCQHCHQLCATCNVSSKNCISCAANRINPPKCDCYSNTICEQCQVGFYQNSNLICIECSQNCKSCNFNGCQICEPNYGLNIQLQCIQCNSNETVIAGHCHQCQSQCLFCLSQLDNCQTCSFLRINPPDCQCQEGYFETSGQCQLCHQLCATCNVSSKNCITCAANRVNAPQCDCPPNGISQIENGILWCSACETAILEIYFSDDLESLIINFGTNLQRDEYLNCSQIFSEETVNFLGVNPVCYTNFNYLYVLLDYDATIDLNNQLNFKDQTNFIIKDCQVPIKFFLNNQVGLPKTSIVPKITFNVKQVKYVVGLEIDVQIKEEQITGMRKLKLDEWKFLSCNTDCQNSNILQMLNREINQTKFQIRSDSNLSDPTVILALFFHNFLGQNGYQTIELIVSNKEIELLSNITFPKQPIHKQKANYEILLYPYLYDSSTQQISISEKMNVTLQLQLYIYSVLVQKWTLNSQTNSYSILKLDTQSLIINENYQLTISVTDNLEFNFSQKMEFIVHEKDPVLYIVGGNIQIGYNQQINLNAILLNNLTELIPQWNCQNLGDSKPCSDQDSIQIQFNNSLTNTLKSSTFPPYSVYQFNVFVRNQNTKSTDQVIVMTIEDNIPQILLSSNVEIKSGIINYYDMTYLNFTYTDINIDPDLLLYSGTFYYNQEIICQVQFKYLDIIITFQDYLDSSHYNKINFKFTSYNANYPVASMYTLELSINKPPQNCDIRSNVTEGVALTDYFDITVINCQDEDQPLQYTFVAYYTQDDLQSDNSIGNVVKGQQLSYFGYSNQMISYLTGQNAIIILVMVKDQQEGISNYTLNLNIFQQNQSQPNYSSILKQSMLNSNQKLIIRDISIIQKHFQIYNSFSQLNLEEIASCLSTLQENQLSDDIDQKNILLLYSQLYNFGLKAKSQQINTQFHLINDNLVSILDQIQLIRSNNDSENNYNQIQYSQKQLNEQIQQSTVILNNLQSANLKLKKAKGRLLVENEVNQNKQLFLHSLSTIESSLSTQQVINSNTLTVNQSEFQISTQKLSQKQLDLSLGSISNQTDQYKYSQTIIKTNPYCLDDDFKKLTDDTPNLLYLPSLISIKSNEAITQLDKSIDYIFDIKEEQQQKDSIFECVSKINDVWSVDVCKNVENGINQIICQCNILSALTLIDAALELADNLVSLFSQSTLVRIQNFNFFSDIFTYALIVETIIFLIMLLQSHYLDYKYSKVQDIGKVFPSIAMQPELIIHIDHADNDGNQCISTTNQRRRNHQTTILSTDSNIPLDFQIQKGQKLCYPTLYQFNSKPQFKRDSESITNEQFEEKGPISSRLALQQLPITIMELNQEMGEETPSSILRTPIQDSVAKRNYQINEKNQFIETQNKNQNQLDIVDNNILNSNHQQRDSKTSLSLKCSNYINEVQNKIPESVNKLDTPPNQVWHNRQRKSFIAELKQHHTQLSIGFFYYIKHYHKLLNIFYRYDLENPRVTRATLLYVSLMGQMAILTFFGKIMSLNTILALSILQSVFGFIYKTLISYSIKSQYKLLNYLGFNLSLISFCLFYFIILASISEYQSQDQSNFWAYAYISNLFLDLVIYAVLTQIIYFALFVKYGKKPFIKKLGKIILPGEEYGFFYGEEIENDQVEQTEIH